MRSNVETHSVIQKGTLRYDEEEYLIKASCDSRERTSARLLALLRGADPSVGPSLLLTLPGTGVSSAVFVLIARQTISSRKDEIECGSEACEGSRTVHTQRGGRDVTEVKLVIERSMHANTFLMPASRTKGDDWATPVGEDPDWQS